MPKCGVKRPLPWLSPELGSESALRWRPLPWLDDDDDDGPERPELLYPI